MSAEEDTTGSVGIVTGTAGTNDLGLTIPFDTTTTNTDFLLTGTTGTFVEQKPTDEFLKSWKWLRILLLKELLSDNPKSIINLEINKKHSPYSQTEYEITIKCMPIKSDRKIRELEKPEL